MTARGILRHIEAYCSVLQNKQIFVDWFALYLHKIKANKPYNTKVNHEATLRLKLLKIEIVLIRCLTLLSYQRWKKNVDLTWFNVLNSSVDMHNVVSMLIWRCLTSRSYINLKTTPKQLWNLCRGRVVISIISCDRWTVEKRI